MLASQSVLSQNIRRTDPNRISAEARFEFAPDTIMQSISPTMNRRSFLAATASLGAALAFGADAPVSQAGSLARSASSSASPPIPTGISGPRRCPSRRSSTRPRELGVEGVDILHRQMDIPEKEPLDARAPRLSAEAQAPRLPQRHRSDLPVHSPGLRRSRAPSIARSRSSTRISASRSPTNWAFRASA